MNLNRPEKNAIILLEPDDGLSALVSPLMDKDDQLFHAHDAAAFESMIKREASRVVLLIATDETEPYDTLTILEAHKDEQWFAGALSFMVAKKPDPARKEKAAAIGIQDYVSLPAVSSMDHEQFVRFWISHEIRLAKKLQRIKTYAHCDVLTGLYNRAAAADVLTGMLQNNPEQEFLFAIIDIDYFKQVNDMRGHEFGDRVLKEESKRIREILGEPALAIRYGGDEFVLMVPMVSDPDEIAQAIYEKTHFMLEDYLITNSIGISTTLSGHHEWERLFQQADQALYIAKANGRNQYCVYAENMPCTLDGAEQDIRSETLNLSTSALIHAIVNGYCMACHLDLNKVAITRLVKTASGEYGWSDPIEYIPFIDHLLEWVEDKSKLRFSEFINPNTLAGRLAAAPALAYFFTGVDGKEYRTEYIAGDMDQGGRISNALMLLSEVRRSEDENAALQDDVTAIEKCLASSLTDTYNAIWIIHPTTLSRDLVSIQTDLSRHRRINRLFEGGNYWEDTQGYVHLYVNEDEAEGLLKALHPDVLFPKVKEKGMVTLYFHRKIDGVTLRCEYSFTNALYGDERVIIQLYRRLK